MSDPSRPARAAADKIRLMTAGRASPVKKIDVILAAVSELPSNETAFSNIRNVPYREMPAVYREHDIFISMSATGSVDKAVLEAMACGLTVIVANEAFRDILPARYFLERRDPKLLAERIRQLAGEPRPNLELRAIVEKNHSLPNTIQKIAKHLGLVS